MDRKTECNHYQPKENEQDTLEAMLKHSRKSGLQRQNKPLQKHAGETFKTPNVELTGATEKR